MAGGKGRSLTTETRDAFVRTLNGLVVLMQKLLKEDHAYVLPGMFQSDRLEGEFGIYRFIISSVIFV